MRRTAHLNESSRSRTAYLILAKTRAAKHAAMPGATAQEAATWETLPPVHLQVTSACEANPTPMSAPTTVCVLYFGKGSEPSP
jgi:hypothetical protein